MTIFLIFLLRYYSFLPFFHLIYFIFFNTRNTFYQHRLLSWTTKSLALTLLDASIIDFYHLLSIYFDEDDGGFTINISLSITNTVSHGSHQCKHHKYRWLFIVDIGI